MTKSDLPIAVDLDGSLILTDMLFETLVQALIRKPWLLLMLIPWLFKGRAYLKSQLVEHSSVDVATLPYNQALVDYLQQAATDRTLVLCTATHHRLAEKIASHLGFFSEVLASDDKHNLAGKQKAKLLYEKFGDKGFVYIGNEVRDLQVWKHAGGAIVVGSRRLADRAGRLCPVEKHFEPARISFKVLLKAIRIHQWSKNALIFVPLIASHQLFEPVSMALALLAFIAFGLCASATYLFNDLADLDSDRRHWKKQHRPLASGQLPIQSGILLSASMLVSAFLLAWIVGWLFSAVLAAYTALTLAYSLLLKRLQTVDILTLAVLYTMRIIAGAAATQIIPSFWLLTLSMFVFFCLAIIKRIAEILKALKAQEQDAKLSGRGYYTADMGILQSLASSAGMVSVLVFAMYINSDEVIAHYSNPYMLWMVCPIFAYWLTRVLIMSSRGEIDEDPITFAIYDSRSWLAGLAIAITFGLAI